MCAKVLLNFNPLLYVRVSRLPVILPEFVYSRRIIINSISMADLSQQDWTTKLNEDDNAFILDVRTTEEFEAGYIPEAVNINIYEAQDFLDALNSMDKSKNYYVYCRSGNRSRQACAIMNSMGFDQAYNLEGGIMEWQGEVTQ